MDNIGTGQSVLIKEVSSFQTEVDLYNIHVATFGSVQNIEDSTVFTIQCYVCMCAYKSVVNVISILILHVNYYNYFVSSI